MCLLHLARLHVQRKALEDVARVDGGVEVVDIEHGDSELGIGDSEERIPPDDRIPASTNPEFRIPNPEISA